MTALEEQAKACGAASIALSAQCRVAGFYEKLGYTQRLGAQSQRMMQSFFGNSLFGNDFFDDFFSPMPSLLGRRMKMLEDPFDDFFAEMPALSASPVQQQEAKQEKKGRPGRPGGPEPLCLSAPDERAEAGDEEGCAPGEL